MSEIANSSARIKETGRAKRPVPRVHAGYIVQSSI